MNKLRLAVMGNNGKNLDDLAQMDGKFQFSTKIGKINYFIFRVCSYFRLREFELLAIEVRQQDLCIQVQRLNLIIRFLI